MIRLDKELFQLKRNVFKYTFCFTGQLIDCDFETDLCEYTVHPEVDLFFWVRWSGPTAAEGSGPPIDHTYGNSTGTLGNYEVEAIFLCSLT